MKTIFFLVLGLFITHAAAVEAKECDYTLTLSNATVQPTSSGQVIQQNFVIRRDKNPDQTCANYRLYFGKGIANSYQRKAFNNQFEPYNYNLHQNINLNGTLKEFNDALNATEFIQGTTAIRRTDYSGSFYLSLPALSSQTNQRAGLYRDIVTISTFRLESDNSLEFEASNAYQVNINIPVLLNISLVNEGEPFNINSTSKVLDFGNMEVNQVLGADMIVNSNTPYQLRVSSFNNGKMINGTSLVGYSLQVNNSTVALGSSKSSPVTVASESDPSPVAGDRFNMKVKILSIPTGASTGVYQDSITITAIAN
jgi:hypothetical protein